MQAEIPLINRRRSLALLGPALALLLAPPIAHAGPLVARTEDIRFFRIGTGTTGGSEFPVGGFLAGAISNPPGAPSCAKAARCGVPGLIAIALTTQGSVDNIEQLRLGLIESALVQADIVAWACRGDGLYAGRMPLVGLRSIGNLFDEAIHLVVRADSAIARVSDLKGAALSIGEEGSGAIVEARQVLRDAGLGEQDLTAAYLTPEVAAERLVAGTLDGFVVVGGAPVAVVAELADRIPIRLVPVEAARIKSAPDPVRFVTGIPAGTYSGVAATPTLGVAAQWVVADTVDADLVYGITRALWASADPAVPVPGRPHGATMRLARATTRLAAPLHPGAARYYREIGLALELSAPDAGR